MEEILDNDINICTSIVIFRGESKDLQRIVDSNMGLCLMSTYLVKYITDTFGEVSKSLVNDMLTLAGDTELEYIDKVIDKDLVEIKILDSGIPNIGAINLISHIFNLKYEILSINEDAGLFVNTNKDRSYFKHNIALSNFSKKVVSFGESFEQALSRIDIVVQDNMSMSDKIFLLSGYNLIVDTFDDKVPFESLNTNDDIVRKYKRLLK